MAWGVPVTAPMARSGFVRELRLFPLKTLDEGSM